MESILTGGNPAENNVVADNTVTPEVKPAENQGNQNAAPEWGKLCGENGAFAGNWREYLPEELRNEACLANYQSFPALVHGFVSAQHAIGSGKVAIPNDRSTPEEWAAFYKAGGRPDNADGYDFSKVELPKGVSLDENLVKEFRKFAFDNGLSAKAASALLGFDIQRTLAQKSAAETAAQSEYNDTLKRIQQEQGGDWKNYISHCQRILDAAPELQKVLNEHGLLSNYAVISFLAGMGEAVGESTLKGGDGGITGSVEAEIAKLYEPGSPLMDENHPGHDAAVQRLAVLLAHRKA